MPNLGAMELIIILVIVLLIFGATRLRDIGQGFGGAINAFRTEVRKGREDEDESQESKPQAVSTPAEAQPVAAQGEAPAPPTVQDTPPEEAEA
jgi:sec-independent protein translocase protein TatA